MRRIRSAGLVALLLPVLAACYEYRAVTAPTPPVGERVSLQITDQGRVSLSERFGPGVVEIQGQVVSQQGNEYVLNVFRVSQLNGGSAAWSGETTRLDRSFIGTVKSRVFSPTRTTIASIAGGAALYLLLSQSLTGSFTPKDDDEPGETPLSVRIPLRVRF